MVAANPLDRDDPAVMQQLCGCRDGRVVTGDRVAGAFEAVVRAAVRAGDRLGVEAAVGWIVVFRGALFVERPGCHRRLSSIVRKGEDDGIARAAVGAIDIGIVKAPVARVEELREAGIAGGKIGRDPHGRMFAGRTGTDREVLQARQVGRADVDPGDLGRRRGARAQVVQERLDAIGRAFEEDLHAVIAVRYPAGERVGACKAVDERPESHPLHRSAHPHRVRDRHGYSPTTQPRPCQPTCVTLPENLRPP